MNKALPLSSVILFLPHDWNIHVIVKILAVPGVMYCFFSDRFNLDLRSSLWPECWSSAFRRYFKAAFHKTV